MTMKSRSEQDRSKKNQLRHLRLGSIWLVSFPKIRFAQIPLFPFPLPLFIFPLSFSFSPAKIIEAKMVADSKGKSDISFAGTFASSAFAACLAEVTIHELVPISLLLMIMLLSC
jgi:hypothetical protein